METKGKPQKNKQSHRYASEYPLAIHFEGK